MSSSQHHGCFSSALGSNRRAAMIKAFQPQFQVFEDFPLQNRLNFAMTDVGQPLQLYPTPLEVAKGGVPCAQNQHTAPSILTVIAARAH
jgi:hypothetical protein